MRKREDGGRAEVTLNKVKVGGAGKRATGVSGMDGKERAE